MWTATTVEDCRDRRFAFEGSVGLVPTMGALHEGHVSLIRRARELTDHVVVSVFVNPTQFGPGEDYQKYPRPLEKDLRMCRDAGADGVFAPSAEEMYPRGVIASDLRVPALDNILEGEVRPGHFAGVCRVVLKLFNIIQPHLACFGEKDMQQLRVIQSLVEDLEVPVEIEPCPTLREPDGLAMSSRNAYLNPEQRRRALGLYMALTEARALIEADIESQPEALERAMRTIMESHGVQPDYAVIRDPMTFQPVREIDVASLGPVTALVAGRVDQVRLIDNLIIGAEDEGDAERDDEDDEDRRD